MVDTQNLKALKASLVIEGFQMNIVNHVFLERYDKPNSIKALGIWMELRLP